MSTNAIKRRLLECSFYIPAAWCFQLARADRDRAKSRELHRLIAEGMRQAREAAAC